MSMPGPPPRKRQQIAYAPATRPVNRDLPHDLGEVIPEAGQYERMRACERRADAVLARKRFDLQDQLSRPRRAKRTLRIWVSNTASDQPWQVADAPQLDDGNFDFESTNIPSWELRVEGKLLPTALAGKGESGGGGDGEDVAMEDAGATAGQPVKQVSTGPTPLFTEFIRSVTVEEVKSEPGSYAEGPILEWHKPRPGRQDGSQHQRSASRPPGAPQQAQLQQPQQQQQQHKPAPGIAVKRKGDADVQVSISLVLDYTPERYKVSPVLQRLLDVREETRAQIVMDIWYYIRANNLLDPEDRRVVHADAGLKEAFGQDRLYFPQVPDLLTQHLSPADPVVIDYTVKTDAATTYAPQFWDIEVEVDDGTRLDTLRALQTITPSAGSAAGAGAGAGPGAAGGNAAATVMARAAEIDSELADLMPVLEAGMAKRAFLKSLSVDPARLLRDWQASQARDLELVCGDVRYANGEQVRRAEFYEKEENKAWLKEGVFHYLASLSR